MHAGRLRHYVTVEEQAAGVSGAYGSVWNDAWATWVDIQPLTVAQRLQALRINQDISCKIETRYDERFLDESVQRRLIYQDRVRERVFWINGLINEDERDRTLKMWASEKKELRTETITLTTTTPESESDYDVDTGVVSRPSRDEVTLPAALVKAYMQEESQQAQYFREYRVLASDLGSYTPSKNDRLVDSAEVSWELYQIEAVGDEAYLLKVRR